MQYVIEDQPSQKQIQKRANGTDRPLVRPSFVIFLRKNLFQKFPGIANVPWKVSPFWECINPHKLL